MALKPREVKQLKILAVVMIIFLAFHGYRMWKKSSKTKVRSRRRGRSVASARRVGRRGGRSSGRRSSRPSRRGRALTPNDIPKLSEDTKRKLKALKNPKEDLIPEDVLRYETRNPFLPLQLSDKQVEQMKREAEVKAKGGKVSADTIYFRGVIHINGEKLAILERNDRGMPWYVHEGERLVDTDFVLQNIAANEMQVSLLNTKAKRERDRIRTIPWSGLEGLDEATDLLAGLSAGTAGGEAGPRAGGEPAVEAGDMDVENGGGPEPGEDDFEIQE